MAGILKDVIQRGTAVRARSLGRTDIGGKTGTTNEAKDAWFAGFHPTNATVVWLGFDKPSTLGRREYGGVAALPVWMDFMKAQLKEVPTQWVSIDNRAKSKTQKRQVVEMTDDDSTLKKEDSSVYTPTQPVKPRTQQRTPLEAEEPNARTNGGNSTPKEAPKRPLNPNRSPNEEKTRDSLVVTPVERMPPLPE